ncbi:MAG: glycosyltransferase [Mycetocola sp.]
MTGGDLRFSLLLPVYDGDRAEYFTKAFASSVADQTRKPDEVIVVQDGPIGAELDAAVADAIETSPVPARRVVLDENLGLAEALTIGLAECRFDIVARMDADDISLPGRFAAQLPFFDEGCDLVGAGMYEFAEYGRIIARRTPPVAGSDIRKQATFHDPFNHPTVVYRKSAVLAAGGYRSLPLMEDYWLFARMIQAGSNVANLADPLVMYRVDAGSYGRRGGRELFRSEIMLQREFLRAGFVTRLQFARNLLIRGGYRFVPVAIRTFVYRRTLARQVAPSERS